MPIITKTKANILHYKNPNLQTILINKNIKKTDISKWLKQHNYHSRMREDVNYYRAMQHHPVKNAEFYSKKIDDNIIFVFQKW